MFIKSMVTTLATISLFASVSSAQDDATTSSSSQTSRMTTPTVSHMNVYDPVGWFPFIGLSGGYMSRNDALLTEGNPGELRLMGSYFSESRGSVLDLGVGAMGDAFSQKSTLQNNFLTGGVAEVAWRVNSASRWQFGPIVDAYYTGDNNRYGSTDPNWTSFGGLQLVKEFPVRGTNIFRVGVKALTDLSIKNQDVNTVMLDLQWGFGADQGSPQVTANDMIPNDPSFVGTSDIGMTQPYTTPAIAGTDTSRRVIETDADAGTLTIRNENHMQFDTGTTDLSSDNAAFVQKIGAALADRRDLFDRVEVIGYADQTGSDQTNMRVSKERAQSVAGLLRQSGLDSTKISSSWKGASEPLYQSLLPEDLQQNRRVDIVFHGVKDQAQLEQVINSVM
jgi:outer membrane protein OmpA-like peptidoglycan-associated protein